MRAGKIVSSEEYSNSLKTHLAQGENRNEVLDASGVLIQKLFYVRDASGNLMATYKKYIDSDLKLDFTEAPIYGSDRLGNVYLNQNIASISSFTGSNPSLPSSVQTDFSLSYPNTQSASRVVGDRAYELKDHLGNVRSVIGNEKHLKNGDGKMVFDGVNDFVSVANSSELAISDNLTIEAWINMTNLSSGAKMIANKKNCGASQTSYYFTVNSGKLQWVWYPSGVCGAGLGKVYETNTAVITNTNTWYHVAVVHGNGTVKLYVDGIEVTNAGFRTGHSHTPLFVSNSPFVIGANYWSGSTYGHYFPGAMKEYRIWNTSRTQTQIANHMNTQLTGSENNLVGLYNFSNSSTTTVYDQTATASNGTINGGALKVLGGGFTHYKPQVLSISDYYAFGSLMPKRNASTDAYRYGFNGMEKDDNIKGNGNSLDFGARMYDSRLGRWLALDPLAAKYPAFTPYSFVNNIPISAIDPDGKEIHIVGNDEYRAKIEKMVIEMAKGSDVFRQAFEQLVHSEVVFVISDQGISSPQGNQVYGRRETVAGMFFNFAKANSEESGSTSVETNFAHEMFHFVAHDNKVKGFKAYNGTFKTANGDIENGEEVDAVHFENKVAGQLGKAMRKTYGGTNVFQKTCCLGEGLQASQSPINYESFLSKYSGAISQESVDRWFKSFDLSERMAEHSGLGASRVRVQEGTLSNAFKSMTVIKK